MNGPNSQQNPDTVTVYHIRVKGILDSKWSDWFDGMTITPLPTGETLLAGPIADQAALHGLLNKIRDVGLPLLSVNRVEGDVPGHAEPGGNEREE